MSNFVAAAELVRQYRALSELAEFFDSLGSLENVGLDQYDVIGGKV